jgi:hypothetical protein
VRLSDVYHAAYQVPGVASVNVTRLAFRRPLWFIGGLRWRRYLDEHGAASVAAAAPERLRILPGRALGGRVWAGELPTLAAADLTLTPAAAAAGPATGGLT